ncbi:MFS transporter [Glycomyces harbinensis]|uniref:Predicted arabinose efflux permease, MFS family n=1 Tax=Glycomyces harbinensis TaxID=58114 RepID=A0A1G6R802_9ACTN|nr:MFS transporter [Glycomyces harbinensis]SDD00543.1 Predicted arabinose efflux permease, MFS family [Glycomyces harbinensis]
MTNSALRERTDPALIRWRNAVFAVFALSGFVFANWAARIPNIRDILGASTQEMGVLILGMAAGAILGLLTSSHVVAHMGASRAISWCLGTTAVGLTAAGLIAGLTPNFWALFAALMVLGAGNSVLDVAMNLSGAANERRIRKTLMPMFHAGFSLGTMLGAGLGALTEQLGVPVLVHLVSIGVLVIAADLYVVRFLQPAQEPAEAAAASAAGWRTRLSVWTDPRILLIGLIILGMGFTEGTANDWLGLAMVDGYGLSNPGGAAVFAVFVTAMTAGRIGGGYMLDRFGRVPVLAGSAFLAFGGLLLVILGPTAPFAIVGTVLWGVGASLGFPVGMSAAADDPRKATASVAAVATIGYFAFLIGPPLIGLLGEQWGLRNAFYVVLVLVGVALLCSPAARPPKTGAAPEQMSETGR